MIALACRMVVAPVPGGWGAKMRVVAHAREGKFHHVGAADQPGARGAQSGHGGAVVLCGGGIGQHHRTGGRHLALHVKQVLDRDTQPDQGLSSDVRFVCCVQQFMGGELPKHVLAGRAAGDGQAQLGLFSWTGLSIQDRLAGGVKVGLCVLCHGVGLGRRTGKSRVL